VHRTFSYVGTITVHPKLDTFLAYASPLPSVLSPAGVTHIQGKVLTWDANLGQSAQAWAELQAEMLCSSSQPHLQLGVLSPLIFSVPAQHNFRSGTFSWGRGTQLRRPDPFDAFGVFTLWQAESAQYCTAQCSRVQYSTVQCSEGLPCYLVGVRCICVHRALVRAAGNSRLACEPHCLAN